MLWLKSVLLALVLLATNRPWCGLWFKCTYFTYLSSSSTSSSSSPNEICLESLVVLKGCSLLWPNLIIPIKTVCILSVITCSWCSWMCLLATFCSMQIHFPLLEDLSGHYGIIECYLKSWLIYISLKQGAFVLYVWGYFCGCGCEVQWWFQKVAGSIPSPFSQHVDVSDTEIL